jgi:hypothetical protein
MPARVLVFCRRSVAHLTAEALKRELDDADLYTLAEELDLPGGEEAAVDAMRPRLHIEAQPGPEFTRADVHWKESGRPLQIERVVDVAAEIEETLENLPEADTAGAREVREHLRACTEIVDLELGFDDIVDLGAPLAEVLAFHIAEQGDGLVWFYHRDWASPRDRGATLWTTE